VFKFATRKIRHIVGITYSYMKMSSFYYRINEKESESLAGESMDSSTRGHEKYAGTVANAKYIR
jgi:hypothetical protein